MATGGGSWGGKAVAVLCWLVGGREGSVLQKIAAFDLCSPDPCLFASIRGIVNGEGRRRGRSSDVLLHISHLLHKCHTRNRVQAPDVYATGEMTVYL